MRKASIFFLALLFPVLAFCAEDVQFAGFAFLGDSSDIEKNYPYSFEVSRLKNDNGQLLLDAALLDKLKETKLQFTLNSSGLANLKNGDSLALVLAMDRETISHEAICGDNKLVIELSAQILVVDFEGLSIVGSYPLVIQYIDAPPAPPDNAYIGGLVKELYLGDLGINMVDEFAKAISAADVKRKYKNRIQVTGVKISEDAIPFLPKRFSGDNLPNFYAYVAQSFGSSLSKNQNVSVLPYTKGSAIGGKMAARFSNGDVYNLAIPEADYSIEISIPTFKKVLFDKNASGSSWVYGVYSGVRVFEDLSGKEFFNGTIKNGSTKLVPSCQVDSDDWPAYQETMLVLFDQFSRQISSQDKGWSKTHIVEKPAIKELDSLHGVIEKCK